MYETDFAALDPLLASSPSFYGLDGGGLDGPGTPGGDTSGGWSFPDGANTMVVTHFGIDEHGNEVREPETMIQLPGSSRWIDYLGWKSGQDNTDPALLGIPDWSSSSVIQKDGYTLEVGSTVSIVNGVEVFKPTVFIKEDGGGVGYMSLNDWEAKQEALEAEKKLAGSEGK